MSLSDVSAGVWCPPLIETSNEALMQICLTLPSSEKVHLHHHLPADPYKKQSASVSGVKHIHFLSFQIAALCCFLILKAIHCLCSSLLDTVPQKSYALLANIIREDGMLNISGYKCYLQSFDFSGRLLEGMLFFMLCRKELRHRL